MLLKNLVLKHFRNYTDIELECSTRLNIFWGANAQGKSNLLEAIYYLGYGRSYRLAPDEQVLQWDRPSFVIRATVLQDFNLSSIDITYVRDAKKKVTRFNGKKISRLAELGRIFPVVLFSPDDLQLTKGAPNFRRHYLDSLLSRLYPEYEVTYQRYQQVLSQRNYLLRLRDTTSNRSLLETYDQQLSQQGAKILTFRFNLLPLLSHNLKNYYREIAGKDEELSLFYSSSLNNSFTTEPNIDSLTLNILDKLSQLRSLDYQKGATSIGPHRDDLIFRIKGKNLRHYGSQGQHRSLVLALRLSELTIMDEHLANRPVLLLDDVLSELDDNRCYSLIKMLESERQVFLTTTSPDNIPEDLIHHAANYQVSAGFIKPNFWKR
ncbi:MAG: DNA replication/repair protein RecF [Bacillota bacterium]